MIRWNGKLPTYKQAVLVIRVQIGSGGKNRRLIQLSVLAGETRLLGLEKFQFHSVA